MWPAPSTSPTSFWTAYQQRQQVRQRPANVRKTGALPFFDRPVTITLPSDDKPAKSSTHKASRPRLSAGTTILGVASRVGVWHSPAQTDSGISFRVSYDPGAFDKCLTRVRNRKRRINLCIGHQTDTVYASTADQSLRVWMEGPELRFRVLPVTSRSRSLIARIHRDDDLRQVSIGCRFLYATKDPYLDDPAGTPDDPIIASIVEVDVYEISLVTRGANPRTWVRFE